MPWKVKDTKWLQVETDRVEAIILMPKYWHRAWTPESLHLELKDHIGLAYSLPEVKLINDELHTRGVVDELPPRPPDL